MIVAYFSIKIQLMMNDRESGITQVRVKISVYVFQLQLLGKNKRKTKDYYEFCMLFIIFLYLIIDLTYIFIGSKRFKKLIILYI